MIRRSSTRRAAFSLLVVAVIAIVVAGGQARANATEGIKSISTQGSTAVQITPNSTEYTLYVPSNHSGDSSELITVAAQDVSDQISIAGSAFFPSGGSIVVNIPTAVHVDVCTPDAGSPSDSSKCDDYLLEIEKTTSNFSIAAMITAEGVPLSSFSPDTDNYGLRVDGSTQSLNVAVQPADTQASAAIQGTGGTSQWVQLNPIGQSTSISIVVTAASGYPNQTTYNLTVSRGATDADLSGLSISPGTLTPDFWSGTRNYTAKVASDVTAVAVTPTNAQNGSSVVTVDDSSDPVDPSNITLDNSDPTHIVITSSAEDPNSVPVEVYTIDVSHLASETLTVDPQGTGHGTVTSTSPDSAIDCTTSGAGCSTNYDEGTSVTLHAEPATGSVFTGWGTNCNGSDADTTFDMPSSPVLCTATFTSLGALQTKSPYTVNDSGDADYGGCYSGLCTLRAALAAASTTGGTIKFTVGTVNLDDSIGSSPAKALTIDGGEGVTIDGGGLSFDTAAITLKGLTIQGAEQSGLYFTADSSATLTNVALSHNASIEGGGMLFAGTTLTMTGGGLYGNQADSCGAFEIETGTASFTDVEVGGNHGEYGGGFCIVPGTSVKLTRGVFFENQASYGGAIYDAGSLKATGTVFAENIGGTSGAAIEADSLDGSPGGTATITNATFDDNPFTWTIEDDSDGTVALVNTTVVGNGGGIKGTNVTLLNTLSAGNSEADCQPDNAPQSLGHNVDGDGSCGLDAKGDKSATGDPHVGDVNPDGTIPLENGSPALDAGTASGAPTKDAIGTTRPQGSKVDIGALEMHEHQLTITTVGNGTVAPDEPPTAGGLYVAGSTVHLTATPAAGGAFGKWTGACTGTNPQVDITMTAGETCNAVFVDPPTITSFSPSHARIRSLVTITGTHLNHVTAVAFGAVPATIKSVSTTTLTVVVPDGVGTDPVAVSVTNAAATVDSGAKVFTPQWPKPKVTSFSPAAAKAGAKVTILGHYFLGVTDVAFNGHDGTISGTPTDTKLTVLVPDDDGASGPITVTTQGANPTGQSATPFLFLPKPENLTIDTDMAAVGEKVTISGNFLGTTKSVTFNGHAAKFTIALDRGSVKATVPDADDDGGTISITNAGGTADVPGTFEQGYVAPTITSFTPTSGMVGSTVTIIGKHFRGTTQVTFNGKPAGGYHALSDTKLTATVPYGAELQKGTIAVTNPSGTGTSTGKFTPTWPSPTITSFTPGSATAGGPVTITGNGFVDVTAVKINGVDCNFTADTKKQITLTVPGGATTGKITVTNNAGTATSTKALTIT